MDSLICDVCHVNPATILISQSDGVTKKEVMICEVCQEAIREKANSLMESLPAQFRPPAFGPPPISTSPPAIGRKAISQEAFNKLPAFIQKSLTGTPAKIYERQSMPNPAMVLPAARLDTQCISCGTSCLDFLYQNYPGCIFCFKEFKDDILEFINSFETTKEKTALVEKELTEKDILDQLEKQKRSAIKSYNFDEAIRCRDEIKKIKAKSSRKRAKKVNKDDSETHS